MLQFYWWWWWAYLNSKLPLGKVDALLALLLCDKGSLVLGESSADGTSLL